MFLPVVLPPLIAALEAEVSFSMEAAQPDEDNQVRKWYTVCESDNNILELL